jgi:hypothetical protein
LPRLECGIVDIQSQKDVENEQKVYHILQKYPQLDDLLNTSIFKDNRSQMLRTDIRWRANYFNVESTFWNLAQSQLDKSAIGILQWNVKPGNLGSSRPPKSVSGKQLGTIVFGSLRCSYRDDDAELYTIVARVWLIDPWDISLL